MGPATAPWNTRATISSERFGASAHIMEAMTKSTIAAVNSFTWPNRRVSQPVSGTEMPFATAKEVITQVPWSGETPRSPAMAGSDTLAIEVSSTFMNVASDSATVPSASVAPVRGGGAAGARCGAPPPTGLSAFVSAMAVSARSRDRSVQAPGRSRERHVCHEAAGRLTVARGGDARRRRGCRRLIGGDDGLYARIRLGIARCEHGGRPRSLVARHLRQARTVVTTLDIDL